MGLYRSKIMHQSITQEFKMHRFYVDGCSDADKQIRITGDDVNHILNVLRLGLGDEITVSDGSSRDFVCSIAEIASDGASYIMADIVDILDNNAELPADIYLFQGVPKGDKMELIIQKCVELGVHAIVPVMMDRTIVKFDQGSNVKADKKMEKRLTRYNSISEAASKQSRRGIIPKIMDYMSMKDAMAFAEAHMDVILFPYEAAEGMKESRAIIDDVCDQIHNRNKDEASEKLSIGIFIGPEGGFSDSEANKLQEIGARTMSLGHRILRTETAGLAIMSVLSFVMDD